MKALFFISAFSLMLTGCLSNRGFNALGEMGDRMQNYYMQKSLMEQQHQYDLERINRQYGQQQGSANQRIYLEHEAKPTSGSYCFQLSDGVHCY